MFHKYSKASYNSSDIETFFFHGVKMATLRIFGFLVLTFLTSSLTWAQQCQDPYTPEERARIAQVVANCKIPEQNPLPCDGITNDHVAAADLFTRPIAGSTNGQTETYCALRYACTGKIIETGAKWTNKFDEGCESHQESDTKAPAQQVNPVMVKDSLIEVNRRVLGQRIPVVGADFDLYYFSNKTAGFNPAHTVRTNLTKGIKFGVTGFVVRIYDDRQQLIHTKNYENVPNQTDEFYYHPGLAAGTPQIGTRILTVEIEENYGATKISRKTYVLAGTVKAVTLGIGGWLPGNYHFYDHFSQTLYYGNGKTRTVRSKYALSTFRIAELDASLVYEFDMTGKHLRTRAGLTGETIASFEHNSAYGFLSAIVQPFGRTTTFNRDANGGLVSITAPFGKVTKVTLDVSRNLKTLTNPKNETYRMSYTSFGLLSQFTKPNDRFESYIYNVDGELANVRHEGGYNLSLANQIPSVLNSENVRKVSVTTGMGRQQSVENVATKYGMEFQHAIDPAGLKTNFEFRPVEKTTRSSNGLNENYAKWKPHPTYGDQVALITEDYHRPTGTQLSSQYDDNITMLGPDAFQVRSWTRQINAKGGSATQIYDGSQHLITHQSAFLRTGTWIDSLQRPTKIIIGDQHPIELFYAGANLTKITQSARMTELSYHPTSGLLQTITNPYGQKANFTFDSADRITSASFPGTQTTNYRYDAVGNLVSLQQAIGSSPSFSFGMNEMLQTYQTSIVLPSDVTRYAYNLDNQLISIKRPDANEFKFDYDTSTGLKKYLSDKNGVLQNYFYNQFGQLRRISEPSKSMVDITYVGEWQSGIAFTNQSIGQTQSFDSTFGAFDKVATDNVRGTTGESPIAYRYTSAGDIQMAGNVLFNYDFKNAQIQRVQLGNYVSQLTYSPYGDLLTHRSSDSTTSPTKINYQWQVSRDRMGRILTKSEKLSNDDAQDFNYRYDTTGRLIEVKANGAMTATYQYDLNSNRTQSTINGVVNKATYDRQNRLTSYGPNTYAFNLSGELITKTTPIGTTKYSYNAFGQLIKVVTPTHLITYVVDPQGKRRRKNSNSVFQANYIYDTEGRIVGETDRSGTLTRRYVYASKTKVPDYFINIANKAQYRIITDHLGSLRMVYNVATGAVVQKMSHDEFGRVTQDTAPGYTPFGFAGGIYDHQTGLVLIGNKNYDAESGRWINKDPGFMTTGKVVIDGYAMNDPVNFADQVDLAGWGATMPNFAQKYRSTNPAYLLNNVMRNENYVKTHVGENSLGMNLLGF